MVKKVSRQHIILCDEVITMQQQAPQNTGNGIFWITDFSDAAASDFCLNVLKYSENFPTRPIICYINSPGGILYSLMSMISVIDAVPNKLITVALGTACSAASLFLSHGDARFVSKYARVMVHESSGGTMGNIEDVKIQTKEHIYENEQYVKLLAKNCCIEGGVKTLKSMFKEKRDIYMNAKQSVDFGIADEIGVPRLIDVSQYQIVLNKDE